ncbi:MAG: nucleotidyltransferase substrate binding protein [Oscillospiraceae bacterium]|nr:nucleotidyltransferase substrate binding protein [Oscillospiraceae bacterium]
MKKNLEKLYGDFKKAVENFQAVRDIKNPCLVVSQAGIIKLFEICCDCTYIFLKSFLEYQGYFLPVTASPQMVVDTACDCGLITDRSLWLDILETRNTLAHIYDEELALAAIKKILSEYIPAFEELKKSIDENWLNS